MKNSVEKMNAVNFLPTIGTAKSWSQIGPDKERRKVGCQVEVALWIRIFWQRQVLHQVIISAKYAHLQTGLTVTNAFYTPEDLLILKGISFIISIFSKLVCIQYMLTWMA